MMMTSNFFHPRTKTLQKLQKLPFTRVMAGQTCISVMKSLSLWKEVAVHLFSKHETFCEESQSWQLSVFSNNLRLPCACIGVKTKTSSWEGYKVAVACTLSVSLRGGIILNGLQIIAFHF